VAGDGGRRSPAMLARSGTAGPDHGACRCRARWPGSWPWPSPDQRAAALKGRDLGLQQLTLEPPPSSRALRRSLSSTSPPLGRVARLASPAARKASRQPLRGAAVTPSGRDTVSRFSPRSSRSTAARLRRRDIRPPRPEPAASAVPAVIIHPIGGYRPLWGGGRFACHVLTNVARIPFRQGRGLASPRASLASFFAGSLVLPATAQLGQHLGSTAFVPMIRTRPVGQQSNTPD
jgi:hypothetical protein